jgi:hypothetical protein
MSEAVRFPAEIDDTFESEEHLDALKAQRRQVAAAHHFDVVVPGWRELLVLRLGSITGAQQQRIVERARTNPNANVDVDFLVAAFVSVLGRSTPTGALAVLVDDEGDPVGLDKRLADMLELGVVRNARDVCVALFAGANSPSLALSSAANEWLEWGRSANEEIDEDFLGE